MHPVPSIPSAANEASFVVRVELRLATRDDYETLHERMAQVGFHKRVLGDNGVVYDLPDAEYFGTATLPYERVRDGIQVVADSVRPNSRVLVTEAVRLAWNLAIAS